MQNSYNIFYTDDDQDDRDFFKEAIADIGSGFSIFTQTDGNELLSILKNPPPSPYLVFLDLNMPIKSGYQVLQEIREMDTDKPIPVIIFSTSSDDGAIQKAKDLGATMYITKPGSYVKFKKLLHSVLALDWENNWATREDFVFTVN